MNFYIKTSSDHKSETRGKKTGFNFNLPKLAMFLKESDHLLLVHIRVSPKTGI